MEKACIICGKKFKTANWNSNKKYCSRQCQIKVQIITCPVCGMQFKQKVKTQRFCSKKCAYQDPITREKHSKTMSKTNKWLAVRSSQRMKKNNPSHNPQNVEKIKQTKRINGTLHIWSGERGGNGKYTPAQLLLASALGWQMEVAIPCGEHLPKGQRGKYCQENGYPTCYKVDLGNSVLKLAIEIDGNGHNQKKIIKQDQKKTNRLKELGWKVLRFTNEEIMNDLSMVLLLIKKKIKVISNSMI